VTGGNIAAQDGRQPARFAHDGEPPSDWSLLFVAGKEDL
jgi:hypothetical protein